MTESVEGIREVEVDARADELAARAQRGDAQAFDDLCRLLRDDVWRYTLALLGDREQAFDATQETFLRAVSAIRNWRGEAPFRVFLLVIARRAVAGIITQEQRRRALDTAQELSETPMASPQTGTVELAELVDSLPPDQRQAFVLTQLLGLSYADAAEVADVALGTIRSRVSRARDRLVEAIESAEGS